MGDNIIKGDLKMAEMQLETVFKTPDGETFNTKTEAQDHMRRPKILEALRGLTENNIDLMEWLVEHRETVINAFDTGAIKRITKAEQKKINAAYDAMKESGDKAFDIFVKNRDKFVIKYKPVPRMKDEEKVVAARNTILAASPGQEQLADWVITNEKAILEAYEAGKEKKAVSPKATLSLAAYQAGQSAKKEALEKNPDMPKADAEALAKKVQEEYKEKHGYANL